MLHFLEERQDYKPRSSIRSKPQIGFGISLETPSSFRNEHSMISPSSFGNSLIETERGGKEVPSSQHQRYNRIEKTDINQIEEAKVVGTGELTSWPDRYHESYRSQLMKNSSRFRHNKGEFSNYIEQVRATNPQFGPLSGEERSAEKSLETKRSIIKKSHFHLESSRDKLELDRSLRKQGSRLLEKMIDEKRTLREKRDKFYMGYRNQLTERKSPQHNDYTLPRILGSQENKPLGRQSKFGLFKTIDNAMLTQYIK